MYRMCIACMWEWGPIFNDIGVLEAGMFRISVYVKGRGVEGKF